MTAFLSKKWGIMIKVYFHFICNFSQFAHKVSNKMFYCLKKLLETLSLVRISCFKGATANRKFVSVVHHIFCILKYCKHVCILNQVSNVVRIYNVKDCSGELASTFYLYRLTNLVRSISDLSSVCESQFQRSSFMCDILRISLVYKLYTI